MDESKLTASVRIFGQSNGETWVFRISQAKALSLAENLRDGGWPEETAPGSPFKVCATCGTRYSDAHPDCPKCSESRLLRELVVGVPADGGK